MSGRRIDRVLVAARGAEGLRLARAIGASGREAVLMMSEDDAARAWVDEADDVVVYVPKGGSGRWPDPMKAASAALDAGCDAVHPGLAGPLCSDPRFAERLANMNAGYLGAPGEVLGRLADPTALGEVAREAGLAMVPRATFSGLAALPAALNWLERQGLPAVMTALGADGLGAPVWLREPGEVPGALRAALGLGGVLLEHIPARARLVAVPVIGDGRGAALSLGDVDVSHADDAGPGLAVCPAPELPGGLRSWLAEESVKLVSRLRWLGVGALRFAVTPDGAALLERVVPGLPTWYGAVEAVYGVDLVDVQLRLTEEEPLGWSRADLAPEGTALALRIVVHGADEEAVALDARPAADPEDDDDDEPLTEEGPEGGLGVLAVRLPAEAGAAGLTVETAVSDGDVVVPGDVVGLITVHAPTRQAAIVRAVAALDGLRLAGLRHSGQALAALLGDVAFWRGPA